VIYHEQLTDEGKAWAEAHAEASVVANVALYGRESGWPAPFVDASVKVANEQGAIADVAASVR
jgi:hypothetical protein